MQAETDNLLEDTVIPKPFTPLENKQQQNRKHTKSTKAKLEQAMQAEVESLQNNNTWSHIYEVIHGADLDAQEDMYNLTVNAQKNVVSLWIFPYNYNNRVDVGGHIYVFRPTQNSF